MSITIAMIGAGSVVFSRNLTGDILGLPELRDCTIRYMDIDEERLEVAGNLGRKMAASLGAPATIETTTDRRTALKGADFVINMVQIGGFNSTLVDFEIPRHYGLNFTIADTTGPGGFFRALRTFPMLSGMCRDMEQLCPRAVLLNYSNPMSMNMQTVFRTSSIRAVGLCHSVQGTFDQLMGYLGEPPAEVAFTCAGINHMAFYLNIEKNGVDQYPRLFAAMEDPAHYQTNKVRFELMRRLGHFVTESSEHNAEYCPWFIPHGKEVIARFDIPIDEYLNRCDGIVDEFDRLKIFSRGPEPIKDVCRSHEYGSTIIHSMVTGTPSVIYGNLVNGGTISNLPRTAIVEAPTLVDRTGLHHAQIGELPPELIAYMNPHVSQHELFIRAAMEGRRDHVYQACMYDPLTAATLAPDQIVAMCDEMIAAYGTELPSLEKAVRVPRSGKQFAPVDARTLRASWDAVQAVAAKDFIQNWQVCGPFPATTAGAISLDQATSIEAAFAQHGVGCVDITATYAVAQSAAAHGGASGALKLAWQKPASVAKNGFVNLAATLGARDWVLAFAYAEVYSVHAREVELGIGSDDGLRFYLNGTVVHSNDCGRGYIPAQDKVVVRLQSGVNRLLLKITQHTGGWGFGVKLPPANF